MTVREIVATAAMVKDRRRPAYGTADVMSRLGIERLALRHTGELSLPDRRVNGWHARRCRWRLSRFSWKLRWRSPA